MSSVAGAVPSWGAVAAAQLRMLVRLQRRDFLVFAGIGGALLCLSLYGLTQLPATPPANPPSSLRVFEGLKVAFVLVGALWPLGVWRKDAPEQRGYFWSLPVPRGPHTLIRAGTGWVLLMGACLAAMLVGAVVAQLYASRVGTVVRLDDWYLPLTAATLAYLLISVLAVLVDSPVRWVVWILVALFGVRIITEALELEAIWDAVDAAMRSLSIAFDGPQSARITARYGSWAMHYPIWFGLGALVLVAGAFRHRDAK